MERDEVIRVCEAYLLHGLVEREPSKVPLAVEAHRIEQGELTGRSGADIAEQLGRKEPKLIESVQNIRWVVDGAQAVAFYELRTTFSRVPVRIAERFRVRDGEIVEIEAVFFQAEEPPADVPVAGRRTRRMSREASA